MDIRTFAMASSRIPFGRPKKLNCGLYFLYDPFCFVSFPSPWTTFRAYLSEAQHIPTHTHTYELCFLLICKPAFSKNTTGGYSVGFRAPINGIQNYAGGRSQTMFSRCAQIMPTPFIPVQQSWRINLCYVFAEGHACYEICV